MLTNIYQKDNRTFEDIVQTFKQKSYSELMTMPSREQLDIEAVSEHTTIEFSKTYLEIDGALSIVLTQFLWLVKNNDPNLIEGMKNIVIPLPNRNPKLYYSGHCQMVFFYVLPNGCVTDDIFVRNEHAEERIIEVATWFGNTDLTQGEERGLPRYMRYEYGDLLVDDDGLKANDLTFVGKFNVTKKLFNQLQLETDVQPKAIYVWHYKHNHYAYAYRDKAGVIQYELSNNFPLSNYINQPNYSIQLHPSRY